MRDPDVSDILSENEKGLLKHFNFYVGLAKHEISADLELQLQMMHYKEFVKFGY